MGAVMSAVRGNLQVSAGQWIVVLSPVIWPQGASAGRTVACVPRYRNQSSYGHASLVLIREMPLLGLYISIRTHTWTESGRTVDVLHF
jgi:hypothetical protein